MNIFINVNITAGCFTCCLTSGLRVYNVDPLVEKAHYSKCYYVNNFVYLFLCELDNGILCSFAKILELDSVQ